MNKLKPLNCIRQSVFLLFLLPISFSGISQFYPVAKMDLDLRYLDTNFKIVPVNSFQISELITVKEFKEYLKAVKKDSSSTFYKAQLPKSLTINAKLLNEILASDDLQNKPMPGVSWVVARNYCTWLNNISIKNGKNEKYDLPVLSQILALNEVYEKSKINDLETWTLNFYDESFFKISKFFDYHYDARNQDPPSLKRKIIYNGCYHMNFTPIGTEKKLHYEYQDSSSRYVGFRIVKNTTENDFQTIQVGENTINYYLKNNHLDGVYQEFYKNGEQKVLGSFFEGQRTGIWSVWDENGVLKVQRNYKNNTIFEFIYPISNHIYSSIYDKYPIDIFLRNRDGFYPYTYVEERAVSYSKRNWRQLSKANEVELFQKVDFKSVVEKIFETDSKWYSYGRFADFKTILENDSVQILRNSFNSWDFSRIEIKEDFFFDLDRLVSESRPIAMSFYKSPTDENPSYTVHFPQVRSALATFKFVSPRMSEIENLDDYFFFHEYRGNIVKVSTYKDLPTKKDLESELGMLMDEHNSWILFNR